MRQREFITLVGGAVAASSFTARAQQPMPVIGFMSARSPEDSVAVLAAFRRGLGEGSLIEGKNVEVQFRWAAGCPHWQPNSLISGWPCLSRSAVSLRRWQRRPRLRLTDRVRQH